MDFETYNLGHLMTTACVHFRATEAPEFALMLRTPGWADSAAVMVNGETTGVVVRPGEYCSS